MYKKLSEVIKFHMDNYKLGYSTIEELKEIRNELKKTVYKNWQYDLISQLDYNKCMNELEKCLDFIIEETLP